eukprot:jgi/Bigna1/138492/aug1.45_g13200
MAVAVLRFKTKEEKFFLLRSNLDANIFSFWGRTKWNSIEIVYESKQRLCSEEFTNVRAMLPLPASSIQASNPIVLRIMALASMLLAIELQLTFFKAGWRAVLAFSASFYVSLNGHDLFKY